MVNSRQKGKRAELEVVKFWEDIFSQAHRHLEYQTREAEQGVDVWLIPNKIGIQVKVGSQVPLKVYKYIEQINLEDGLGFVMMRRDRKDWLVVLRAEDFKRILGNCIYVRR